MRRGLMLTGGLVSIAVSAMAQDKLPRGVHPVSELEAVQKEAIAAGRPITIVYTDPKSTCPLAQRAAQDIMSGMARRSEVVLVNVQGDDRRMLPREVMVALSSERSGFIPKTVVMDPFLKEAIHVIPYHHDADVRADRMREARRKFEGRADEWKAVEQSRQAEQQAARRAELAAPRTWGTQDGATLEAQYVSLQYEMLTLKDAEGTQYRIHIGRLKAEDQALARELDRLGGPPGS